MPDTLRLAGALVAPHSHEELLVGVREADVPVMAAASVLDFGAGFDVTQGPAGEANIALDLTESVWTFAQGGFRFRDESGPLLSTGASGDDLLLTGDLDISGHLAAGKTAAVQPDFGLYVDEDYVSTALAPRRVGFVCNVMLGGSHDYASVSGVEGLARKYGTGAASSVVGLYYECYAGCPFVSGGYIAAIHVTFGSFGGVGTIPTAYGIRIESQWASSPTITNLYGVYIPNITNNTAAVTNAYGLRILDFTVGTNRRLLEIGPTTPYLRLVGGSNPGANQTNLYLAEGVTPTLRRVQWKDYSSLAAGDKVMVLV